MMRILRVGEGRNLVWLNGKLVGDRSFWLLGPRYPNKTGLGIVKMYQKDNQGKFLMTSEGDDLETEVRIGFVKWFPMINTWLDGVEKDPLSPARGQVVCLTINLWDSPLQKKVVARGIHGTPVQVLKRKFVRDDRMYLKVRLPGWRARTGWVSENFTVRSEKLCLEQT